MRILIIGAGSIGVYLGAMLHAKNHTVELVGRSKLRKLHSTILINTKAYILPSRLYSFPRNRAYDIIFITSKLYDFERNLRLLHTRKITAKYVFAIQNGIVDNAHYATLIPSGFATISVFEGFRIIENQLLVSKTRAGWKTATDDASKRAVALLNDCGITCSCEKNLESIKAQKTIMNCCVNALSAIERKTFVELFALQRTKKVIDALFDESYAVLRTQYVIIPKHKLYAEFCRIVSKMPHYSSTYQDAVAGKRTEIEFLNGLILRIAKKCHVLVPATVQLLKEFKKEFE